VILVESRIFAPRLLGGTLVKRILISAAAALAFATAGHADELSDIQAQSKQLREQNQALTKRLADLERRQRKLETRSAAAARPTIPANGMAAR
jgi:cell division protein FtsB